MLDLDRLMSVSPELLLSSSPLPAPRGPVRLSLSSLAEREAPAVLAQCFARVGFRYEMERLPDMPFRAELALNLLPGAMVAAGTLHGSRNRRRRGIIDDSTDDAVLLVNIAGPHLIEQFGRELELQAGEAVLLSGTDPSCFTHKPPGQMMGLRVPKPLLQPLVKERDMPFMRLIPRGDTALRHLTNYVGLTWHPPSHDGSLAAAMGHHLRNLMALVAGAAGDGAHEASGSIRAARLHRLKQDIREELSNPALSVDDLAARHRCSARSIQRLFEEEGTSFTAFVLAERLELARRKLSDIACAHEKIASLAFDSGFGDISYFNRTFRKAFGMTPGEARR